MDMSLGCVCATSALNLPYSGHRVGTSTGKTANVSTLRMCSMLAKQ